jgi:pimeloyl-ACP methyl ester carboxylesterase
VVVVDDFDLHHDFAEFGEVRLHYVEAGEGPLVVLLHGFPDFWFGWRFQITALVRAGFRVVAPDLRGYNLSARPAGVSAYDVDRLAEDVRDLIHDRGADRAFLAGHDWGAEVAWVTAANHPEVVERLAILNGPHPRRALHAVRRPRQLARSWYMIFFQLPWLPERLARINRWWFFRWFFRPDDRPGALSPQDIERYIGAWSQAGAATAMVNYYRALFRETPRRAEARIRPVHAPTLVIWGQQDRFLGAELAEPDHADVPRLHRVVRIEEASHWVQHDQPARVAELLVEFFGRTTMHPRPST